jgi:hypothetical protein
MSLYEVLQETTDINSRQEIAGELIAGIRAGEEDARLHYWLLVSDILANELEDMPDGTLRWAAGEFSPSGCGASAFLTVGAAVLHPDAEVIAYEVNETAAECARLLGRISRF